MEDNADIAIGDITEEVENQQSSSSACSYFVMKALSMDSLEEMRDRKCFDALNPILHTKILEHLRERDVTLIVTVNGSRSFQAHAKVNREECLSKEKIERLPVDWSPICQLSFHRTTNISNSLDEGRPVKNAKDGQEVNPAAALSLIHLIENTSAGIEASGEVLDSDCADIDDLDVLERPPDDTMQSDIIEKSKVRSRDREMRDDFGKDVKIKRTSGNAHNRPDDNRDQFGGSGIIPFNVSNMSYEEYLHRHQQMLNDRYHDFMRQHPDYFTSINYRPPMNMPPMPSYMPMMPGMMPGMMHGLGGMPGFW